MQNLNPSKPEWIRIKLQTDDPFKDIKAILKRLNLHTICESAHCPNIFECWNSGTATFMILGDTCTRGCRFCTVGKSVKGISVDENEPEKLASAVKAFSLDYVVLTSVCRDDLEDGGAEHFANCIKAIKKETNAMVEVLIPDFRGKIEDLKKVADVKPEVIAHNIETVRRLQGIFRDRRANYEQSLSVLENVKKLNPNIFTKSSIIVGFRETEEEVIETMRDSRKIGVDFLTIGQYLRPSNWHIQISEYVSPEKFEFYKKKGEELGFKYVASGPFVRSSYHAGEVRNQYDKRRQIK